MSELSPEAASLIASERHGQNPSETDRERVRTKLARELGVAAFAVGVTGVAAQRSASLAKASGMSLGAKLGLAGLCAAVIGGAVAFTLQGDGPKQSTRAPEARPAVPAPAVEVPPEPAHENAAPRNEATPVVRESVPPKPSVGPRGTALGKELALLTSSQRALRESRFAEALALAKKHEAAHPDGLLRVERMAVVALAHCGLGEKNDPSIAVLLEAAPHSPLSARVRAECGVE